MSSVNGIFQTASTALSGGIIAVIVVGSVLGVAALVGFIICMYCLCCRSSKKHRGVIIQPAPYPAHHPQQSPYPQPGPNPGNHHQIPPHSGNPYQASPHARSTNNNIAMNKVR